MKRFLLIVLMLALVTGSAFAEAADQKSLSARTFQFKHKQPEKAAAVIRQLMSAEGTISIQRNALVVSDYAENMKQISAALAQFDTPAQQFQLTVRLVSAGKSDAPGRVKDELKDVAAKLAVLRYNTFESLGYALAEAKEGEPGLLNMDGYRAEFNLGEYDLASDSVKVSDLRISRVGTEEVVQVLKTTLNLKLGQTVILAATRQPQSQRALMIVVTAKR